MTLLSLDTPVYIKRTKVRTNFVERHKLDPDMFDIDYEFELPLLIQNVVGIELTNYAFSTYLFPTFAGRFKSPVAWEGVNIENKINGGKTVDIEFGDADGIDTITLTFDFERIDFSGATLTMANRFIANATDYTAMFAIALGLYIYPALPVVGAFDPADYTLDGSLDGHSLISLNIRRILAPFDYGRVRFLFATGPSNRDSAHKQLGFDKVDTTPDPITNGVLAQYIPNPSPFRYIDINIREFDEFKPVARAFAGFKTFSQPWNPTPRTTRLLSRPLQRLTSLNINISLAGGLPPANFGSRNHNLEFTILSLEPSVDIPSWVTQKISY